MKTSGLFVGLITLDFIYLTTRLPRENEKIVAQQQQILAGGPATNAAITYSCLGNKTKLSGVLGKHPLSSLINNDLRQHELEIIDLAPNFANSPPVSSIFITQATGSRTVVSINATKAQAQLANIPPHLLSEIDIVLIDGHQLTVSLTIAKQAKQQNIPVAIDGGSWKPGFESILPYVDYAICSDNFYPPNCQDSQDVIAYLSKFGIAYIAITRGANSILYSAPEATGELLVPQVKAIDTLGAGDIFHGAFCHYIRQQSFISALASAAKIASHCCQFFGTRQGLQQLSI